MMSHSARLLSMIFLVLTVAACGGRDEPEDGLPLNEWVGESERAVVLKWGAPDTVYALRNGNSVLTWRRSRTEQSGGGIYTVTEKRIVDGKQALVPIARQAPVVIHRLECMTNIEIDPDGYVLDLQLEGNDCHAPAPY